MTATLEGGEWSVARPGHTLTPGKTRYPFYRRLGGPQGRPGSTENLVPAGIRSRTIQPVVRRYTDWTTRPTHTHTHIYIHTYIYIHAYTSIYIYIKWTPTYIPLIPIYAPFSSIYMICRTERRIYRNEEYICRSSLYIYSYIHVHTHTHTHTHIYIYIHTYIYIIPRSLPVFYTCCFNRCKFLHKNRSAHVFEWQQHWTKRRAVLTWPNNRNIVHLCRKRRSD